MTAAALAPLADARTMFRRRLLHLRRYPTLTAMLVGQPVLFLILFVYVFGGTLGAGLGQPTVGGRAEYLRYLTPAILVIAVATVAVGTAVAVAMDMTSGIIARFRTMAIAPSAVLSGHVLGAMAQSALAAGAAAGVAVGIGYRPDGSAAGWVGAAAIVLLLSFALTWLTVGYGLAAKNVESASNLPMLLVLLPFIGSGFVPPASMPVGLRWFAERQPFTPIIDAIRGLLDGRARHSDVIAAVAWSIVLAVVGWTWARHVYRQERAR